MRARPEAVGQRVLQGLPHELGTGERAPFAPAGLGVAIAERHLAITAGEDRFGQPFRGVTNEVLWSSEAGRLPWI